MVDISNKALALVLVVAVVVSIGGTLISLNKLDAFTVTGLPVQDAQANLTIAGSVAIEFVVNNVDFGSGFAAFDSGETICDVATNGTFNTTGHCRGFNDDALPLVLRNVGNIVASVNLSFSDDGTNFITGTGAGVEFFVEDKPGEEGSCSAGMTPTTFSPVINQTICTEFQTAAANDELNIHLLVNIPSDANTGNREMTVTATAYG